MTIIRKYHSYRQTVHKLNYVLKQDPYMDDDVRFDIEAIIYKIENRLPMISNTIINHSDTKREVSLLKISK